jgi:hypothetical protein
MKDGLSRLPPLWLGIATGALISVVLGWLYLVPLREPGSAYYPFACLVFLVGPLLGGMVAAWRSPGHRPRAFLLAGGAVFAIAFSLFFVAYAALPQFARANVRLPESCAGFDGTFDPPSGIAYTLPDGTIGILLAEDARSAVVARPASVAPFATDVFLLDMDTGAVLQGFHVGNDVVSAAVDDGIAYIYNDKLGYLFDSHTGEFAETLLLIDNYGGLSESDRPIISRASDGHWYMETTAVISSWHLDWQVRSRPHLTFNGIARGCYIDAETGDVTPLQ